MPAPGYRMKFAWTIGVLSGGEHNAPVADTCGCIYHRKVLRKPCEDEGHVKDYLERLERRNQGGE